jgi:hypothetical protein
MNLLVAAAVGSEEGTRRRSVRAAAGGGEGRLVGFGRAAAGGGEGVCGEER